MAKASRVKAPKTKGERPRFHVEALRETAGDKVFERGVEYHEDGMVKVVAIAPDRVVADVQGSELYRTELTGTGRAFSGACTCPAVADWGFCKHMVATALAANALAPAALDALQKQDDRLRAHLRAQGVDALIATIMRLADDNPALRRELELAAAGDESDGEALRARFEKALLQAVQVEYDVGYRGAGTWAQEIETVLDQIERLIGRGHAAVVLRLIETFFDELEEAIEQVGDSDGESGRLAERALDIHAAACRAAKPDPVALARDLFARETESSWGFFQGASRLYADVLGKQGRAEYRRLAEQAWSKIVPVRAGEPPATEGPADFRCLEAILDGFAEEAGDLDARVALRAKDLSTPYRYLAIAELLRNHGRAAEALKWAEEGLSLFEDKPDGRLAACAAELHQQLGHGEEAARLLWQCFERQPSLDLYNRLQKAAGTDRSAAAAVTDKAVALLTQRLAGPERRMTGGWNSPADVVIDILLAAHRLPAAWEAQRLYGCGIHTFESLAQASERDHPAEAIAGYTALVERHVGATNQHGYDAAWRLLERIRVLRERHGEGAAHAAHLAALAQRHKAKRNFIKLLQSRGAGAR